MTPESEPKLTVLSVCETALGGVGRYQDCLRTLEGRDFRVAVLMPEEHVQILNDNAEVRTFARGQRGVAGLRRLIAAFLRERNARDPDIVFFNSTFTLFPLAAMRLLRDKRPAVYCAHCWAVSNYEPLSIKWYVVKAIEGRLCGLADLVVNVSTGDAELARSLGYRGRHMVIENAVGDVYDDTRSLPFGGAADRRINLLFVGRFDRQKGLDLLLPAFESARKRNPRLHLHLVGGAVRRTELPAPQSGVTLHGWQPPDKLDSFYRAADVLVVPSRWEGLPLVVPEALRNGTPVIVSNRSAMAKLVEPGVTGDVFELNEAAIAGCLERLDQAALRAMRPAARAAYESRFSIDRFSAEMSAALRSLLESGR